MITCLFLFIVYSKNTYLELKKVKLPHDQQKTTTSTLPLSFTFFRSHFPETYFFQTYLNCTETDFFQTYLNCTCEQSLLTAATGVTHEQLCLKNVNNAIKSVGKGQCGKKIWFSTFLKKTTLPLTSFIASLVMFI